MLTREEIHRAARMMRQTSSGNTSRSHTKSEKNSKVYCVTIITDLKTGVTKVVPGRKRKKGGL